MLSYTQVASNLCRWSYGKENIEIILLQEIKAELLHILEVDLDVSSICTFFHAQGSTRQKMQLIAKQRDELKCASYAIELSVHKPEMFIFLDETGCDRQNALRWYAYS